MPELICLDCIDNLNNAFKFRKQCELSDQKLREVRCFIKAAVKIESNTLNNNDQSQQDDNINFDIKSESSDCKNDIDFHDTSNIIHTDPDTDDEDESLAKRLLKQNLNRNENIIAANVKSEKDERNSVEPLKSTQNNNKVVKSSGRAKVRPPKKSKKLYKKEIITEGGIPCSECNKSFELESDLEIHMITHQQNMDELICTRCSKTFDNIKNLRKHVPIHMTNKPYRCTFCPKSFAGAGDRNRHIRTHTGKK